MMIDEIDQKAKSQPKHQSNPQIIFQYSQQFDPHMKEDCFLIKIIVTADMRAKMQQIINVKHEKLSKLQAKQKLAQFIKLRQKYENYKKMDERVRQQQKKRNPNSQSLKSIAQYENYLLLKDKYSFSLFETFQNRGKYNFVKFGYNAQQQYLTIKINKRYFLTQLNLSRKDLFNIGISFTRTWQHDYYRMINILWRCYVQTQKNIHYTVTISKIDMISATFDIIYLDKKIYRFRYSPFQFRNTIPFRTDHHFTGYYQSISCIHDLYNTKIMTTDNQYYYYNRLFIFDDLTDKQIFIKIFARSHIFFQMYSISKGTLFNNQNLPTIEMDDYFKKCLGQFYFTSIRLKKFMFTWSFKVYKRLKTKSQMDREVILNVPFYFEQIKQVHNIEPFYRIRMQLLQKIDRNSPTSMLIPAFFKEQLITKIRQWYFFVKEIMMFTNKERIYIDNQKAYFISSRKSSEYEDYQINLQFFSKDKIDKFFIGLLLIVSTAIDRYYFYEKKSTAKEAKELLLKQHQDRQRKIKDERVTYIESPQTQYIISKKEYIYYNHSIKIFVRHRYLPQMFTYNKEDEREKASLNNFFNTNKNSDYKIKCGEWRIEQIGKVKRKEIKKDNQKQETQTDRQAQCQTVFINISSPIRSYFATLLRHIPLRMIYKDIIYFLDRLTKTCYYMPHKQSANLLLTEYEYTMDLITRSLLKEYYYCQFKQKDQKIEKELIHNYIQYCQSKSKYPQEAQYKLIEPQKIKVLQKIQDLFSKIIVIKIVTRQDIGYKYDKNLLFQVTFKILEFKNHWIPKIKEGFIMLRVFQNKIEFQKQFNLIYKIDADLKNKKITEEQIRKGLQKCQIHNKLSLLVF